MGGTSLFSIGVIGAAALIGVLVGIIFLILGIRGRRIDDHPLCRKCRFDQTSTGERLLVNVTLSVPQVTLP